MRNLAICTTVQHLLLSSLVLNCQTIWTQLGNEDPLHPGSYMGIPGLGMDFEAV